MRPARVLAKMGINCIDVRKRYKELLTIPFTSSRKRMITVITTDNSQELIIHVKGAPDLLLSHCSRMCLENDVEVELEEDPELKANIQTAILKQFAKEGFRTILVASKTISADGFDPLKYTSEESISELESDLTLLGIFGIESPLREGVQEAVSICKEAGITVRMVTGDDIDYAKSIGIKAGILRPEEIDFEDKENYKPYACMLGSDFENIVGGMIEENGEWRVANKKKFNQLVKDLKVLARSQPDHKYLLVSGLKESQKNVVAVTGDGTNDAPALKKADIGFAMGISGTEIAKQAADIILLDDNFSSIVTAIKWGRNIFFSIRKFLQFQFTVNIVALFLAFLTGLVLGESVLNSVQMLWVNLIMDTFAALALATELPTDQLLQEQPYSRKESIFTFDMLKNIVSQSTYQIIVLVILVFWGPSVFNSRDTSEAWTVENGVHFTVVFNTFVFLQVFNLLNCRKISSHELNIFANLLNNVMLIFIVTLIVCVQILLVEYGGVAVKCSPLTPIQHFFCILLGALSLAISLASKLVPKRFLQSPSQNLNNSFDHLVVSSDESTTIEMTTRLQDEWAREIDLS